MRVEVQPVAASVGKAFHTIVDPEPVANLADNPPSYSAPRGFFRSHVAAAERTVRELAEAKNLMRVARDC